MIGRWEIRPAALQASLTRLVARFPDAVLVRNQVGNLTVLDQPGGEYVGYVELAAGGLTLLDELPSDEDDERGMKR